jgi:LacI family transcriptional regulator
MPATARDVAKRAGVSIATVSYVYSGRRFVSPELIRRVRKAMEELDYHPSAPAQSLSSRRTHSIGLLISDITNPYFPEVARGVLDEGAAAGYNVLVCNTDSRVDRLRHYVNMLRGQRVDGMIFTSIVRDDLPVLRDLLGRHEIPIVLANRRSKLDTDFVGIDNWAGARTLMDHLLSLGYRRIGFISGPGESSASAARMRGYREALKTAKIRFDAACVAAGDLTEESGYLATKTLMARATGLRAIFAANDAMAMGALNALADLGFNVPAEVAVSGFDDMWFASSRSVQLTTIHQPRYELGKRSMQLLLERIRGERTAYREVILPTRLVVRNTCGANALGSEGAARVARSGPRK